MDKIIWSDGHTTTISREEAFRRQYEVQGEYNALTLFLSDY